MNRDLKIKILGAIHALAVGAGSGRNQFARMINMPKSRLSMILSGERETPDDIEQRIFTGLRVARDEAHARVRLIASVMNQFKPEGDE